MKTQKSTFVIVLLLFCFNCIIVASPMNPDSVLISQPNGSSIWLIERGDEYYSWVETTDGKVVTRNTDSIYEYAIFQDGKNIPSGIIAHNRNARNNNELLFLNNLKADNLTSPSDKNRLKLKQIAEGQRAIIIPQSPVVGNRKLLTILIDFSDKPFIKSVATFDSIMNQVNYNVNGSSGSVRDFYLSNSYGKLDIQSTVIGIYRANNSSNYYRRVQGVTNPNTKKLVVEAVNWAANTQNIDFSLFDGNNDGYVDGVHLIVAGVPAAELSNTNGIIWPHHSQLDTLITKNGKIISEYMFTTELIEVGTESLTSTIGHVCHELGHLLGSPDFNPTNNGLDVDIYGTGQWDIMGTGAYNGIKINNQLIQGTIPSHHNPYTKTEIFKWTTANPLNTQNINRIITAYESSLDSDFYKISTPTIGEYYILENKKIYTNLFPNGFSGLLFYHIHSDITNSLSNNTVNTSHPQKCYLVNPFSEIAIPTNLDDYELNIFSEFPCDIEDDEKIFFTSQSTPRSQSWAGDPTGVDICFIQRVGNNIKFVVNPEIEGPDEMCSSAQYVVHNIPEGATISWQCVRTNPINLAFYEPCITSSTTDTIITLGRCGSSIFHSSGDETREFDLGGGGLIDPPFPPFNPCLVAIASCDTVCELRATVTSGGNSYTMTKRVRILISDNQSIDYTHDRWSIGVYRTFTFCGSALAIAAGIEWNIRMIAPYYNTVVANGTGGTFTFAPPAAGTYVLTMTSTKSCDDVKTTTDTLTVYSTPRLMVVNPVTNGTANISIYQEEEVSNNEASDNIYLEESKDNEIYTLELWHDNLGCVRTINTSNKSIQINVSNLPIGVYVLLLKQRDGTILDSKKVLINNN